MPIGAGSASKRDANAKESPNGGSWHQADKEATNFLAELMAHNIRRLWLSIFVSKTTGHCWRIRRFAADVARLQLAQTFRRAKRAEFLDRHAHQPPSCTSYGQDYLIRQQCPLLPRPQDYLSMRIGAKERAASGEGRLRWGCSLNAEPFFAIPAVAGERSPVSTAAAGRAARRG